MEPISIIQDKDGQYIAHVEGGDTISAPGLVIRCANGVTYHFDRDGLCMYT